MSSQQKGESTLVLQIAPGRAVQALLSDKLNA
jgi:hypothetical protein